MNNERLHRFAIHEAGHCVAYYLARSRISYCEISREDGTTVVNHPLMRHLHKIRWPHAILKSFVDCALAGHAANLYDDCNVKSHSRPADSDSDDVAIAMSMMKTCGWIPPTTGYSEADFFRNFSSGAKILCTGNWSKVQALANELEKKKKMSGQAVARLLETKFDPLPTGVLRWWKHKKEGK